MDKFTITIGEIDPDLGRFLLGIYSDWLEQQGYLHPYRNSGELVEAFVHAHIQSDEGVAAC